MPYSLNVFSSKVDWKRPPEGSLPLDSELFLWRNTNIGMEPMDDIVIMGDSSRMTREFSYIGSVEAIDLAGEFTPETKLGEFRGSKRFRLKLRLKDRVPPASTLESLAYSLLKVRRFDEPAVHFRRPYSYLSEEDFDTIKSGRIFLARTLLGMLANALPWEHRVEFVRQSIGGKDTDYINGGDYYTAAERLLGYIHNNIRVPGMHLVASMRIAEGLVREGLESLAFGDSENERLMMRHQAQRFLELEGLDRQIRFSQTVLEELESSRESDTELSNRFAGAPWPIVLKRSRWMWRT